MSRDAELWKGYGVGAALMKLRIRTGRGQGMEGHIHGFMFPMMKGVEGPVCKSVSVEMEGEDKIGMNGVSTEGGVISS
ncbi:hypothetical protein [Pajaroellobacter abortibovis]|uniref:Uncharacterized protein n=1 Tax=Pajaroellobacter abortibovis TaxID=1882918 RepID=A0A1L6MWN2_9BACT|nr:hypothetical protein [Pajaroellobacter abortibovis]APR99931.1 hypothetical protein BCY86_03980 [Pajaroellobacter abortibovis]